MSCCEADQKLYEYTAANRAVPRPQGPDPIPPELALVTQAALVVGFISRPRYASQDTRLASRGCLQHAIAIKRVRVARVLVQL
jgi:hypothetical protein